MSNKITVLGIESSCDDTSASVIEDTVELSNVIAQQDIHREYGGVVPELASRAHQKNIVPVVDVALKRANKKLADIDAVAYTRGPGLLGSLLVGSSFASGLSMSRNIPVIPVNHMEGHILAHFIKSKERSSRSEPEFPFLCLTVSGGHTQLVKVSGYFQFEILGETRDDAAGEAFDKIAKLMGLEYPGGPLIDKMAQKGNPDAFRFPRSNMAGYDFSFSGLKTSVLYKIQDEIKGNPNFLEERKNDIAASVQRAIVEALLKKIKKAVEETGIKDIALAGGVSANSELRNSFENFGEKNGLRTFIPDFKYCTDNAAMIAVAGYFKFKEGRVENIYLPPKPNLKPGE